MKIQRMNIPYANEDMEGVRQVALQHLREQVNEICDDVTKELQGLFQKDKIEFIEVIRNKYS